MHRSLVVLLLAATATPAHALETWMWGIGPKVGTEVLPGRYPARLPRLSAEEGETGPRADQALRVQHDLQLGVEGVYYMDRHHRIGFTGGVGIGLAMDGRRHSTWELILTYDYAIQGRALDVLFGGGIGAGTMGFRNDTGRLRVNTFPVRAEVSGLARDTSRGYQLTLYAQYDLPSSSTWTLAVDDSQPDLQGGIWFTTGLEISVQFGDFEPPRAGASPVRRVPDTE
jgi:hypothetical protein